MLEKEIEHLKNIRALLNRAKFADLTAKEVFLMVEAMQFLDSLIVPKPKEEELKEAPKETPKKKKGE